MNIKRAFTYVFADPHWPRQIAVLAGLGISLSALEFVLDVVSLYLLRPYSSEVAQIMQLVDRRLTTVQQVLVNTSIGGTTLANLGVNSEMVMGSIIATLGLLFLVGIIGLCWVSGYYVELIRNVRDGQSAPLPASTTPEEHIRLGWPVGMAYLIYLLMTFLVLASCLLQFTDRLNYSLPAALLSGPTLLAMLIVMVVFANFMVLASLSIVRYACEERFGVFFEWGALGRLWTTHTRPILRWAVVFGLLATGLELTTGWFPYVGYILEVPVQLVVRGYFLGHFAMLIEAQPSLTTADSMPSI